MTNAQCVASIGLILDVVGAALFIIDSNRLFALLSSMVKQMAEDHGYLDSKKFTKNEMDDLQKKINSSRIFTTCGYIFFIIGFLLQLFSNFIK